jgi:hypothetical protein
MSKLNELNSYIFQVQRRLRFSGCTRGAAILTGTALLVTLLLVLLLNHFAFPERGIVGARLVLLVALSVAAAFGIAFPVARLSRARAVSIVEARNPELEQRLTTFHQAESKGNDPFLELLAADTLRHTQHVPPAALVPDNRLLAMAGAALGCVVVLLWLIVAGPGYVGYGASLLWVGMNKDAHPLYSLSVSPGNIAVRRHSDQLITAHVSGMRPSRVQLFAHYQSGKGWEPAPMQLLPDQTGAATYQFVLAGLPENLEYFIAAGPLTSPHYNLRVVDLPSIKQIQVTYRYPGWTGMKPAVSPHSGDLRAIEGTDAAIEIETDRPLQGGELLLDSGQAIQLAGGENNRYRATIHMEKDGAYHLAAFDAAQSVRLSEDYFIATDKAQPPEVSIDRPRGDYRAIPIEEVKVGVNAADGFSLREMQLHYSVNGGPERTVNLLATPGAKQAEGSHTLPLEDFKLVPGDLISLYATARDGHAEARTDISFIQVEPFEREFSQSQQSGGGGGGGGGQNNQTEISKREKELIAATWKQQNDKSATAKDATVQGQFLADAQQKLRDQVLALSARIESRDLSAATEEFSSFDNDMQAAAEAMAPSAQRLKAAAWKDALPLEQKALQALLRAEATFRKIQVAFGQSGGGSGGGNAGRDLASLFDLELDTEKNQYETAQSASPAEQREKQIEDALAKLDALAKRQQEQAEQQPKPQQSFEQRWQQEMLRREAEELKRQMEELARNNQQGQQGASTSSSSNGKSQQPSGEQQGSQAANGPQSDQPDASHSDPRIQQALQRLQDAADAMKSSGGPQQNQEAARQAAEQLRQAEKLLAGSQQQLASSKLGSLASEAARLQTEERAQAKQIDQLADQQVNRSPSDLSGMMDRLHARDRLAQQRQQLSDDLSSLQRNMRDGARSMASNEPEAAKKLRDALTEMDNADLDNHVQRTADWLRRGINPNSNGTEDQIAQGLTKLQQQLQQAQQAARNAHPEMGEAAGQDQEAELDTVEQLRHQIDAMMRSRGVGRDADINGENQPNGSQRRSSSGGSGQGNPRADNPGTGARSSDPLSRLDRNGAAASGEPSASGDLGGEVRRGGTRSADATAWGNLNTGNNQYGAPGTHSNPSDAPGNPEDSERTIRQGLRQLNQLRQTMKGNPEAAKAAEELAREMQLLDPRRFPGNPAIVEQMHQQLLGSIDRLELQLERGPAAAVKSRIGKSDVVPEGYQDAVAEYFRQLSKNQ